MELELGAARGDAWRPLAVGLRRLVPVLACASWMVLGASSSWAQGGFDFGDDDGFVFEEDEIEPVAISETVARFLDEGLQYYAAEDYISASIFFWRVIQDEDPGAAPLRPRAEFELAKTLSRMRLYQPALYFFERVIAQGDAHPHFEEAAPWLILIAQRMPGDFQMLRRVRAFEGLFPDRIEPQYHDEMAFMLGRHFYNTGELERALQYLSIISEFSPYYPRALFYLGITYVRNFEAQPASRSFQRLLQLVEDRRGRDEELQRLGELARLSLARTLYSTGEFDRAAEFYSQIPRGSRYWLDSLFESAWADFQRQRFNRALGSLHSLNSPFFDNEFFPEAPILQAVILFYNCRYQLVRQALDEFDFVYEPLFQQLEETMAELGTADAYYGFLRDAERRGDRLDPRLQQIVNATLADRTVEESLEFISQVERELRRFEQLDRGWAGSEFGMFVRRHLEGTREAAVARSGALVQSRFETLRDELDGYRRQATAILVETELAEAGALSAGLAAEVFRGDTDVTAATVRPDQIRWTFRGEYWRDEIGHYYYRIRSDCQ